MSEDDLTEVALELDLTGPFTLNEIVEIEALCGDRMPALIAAPTGEFMRAVAWVIGRRVNPGLSLTEAGEQAVKLDG